MLSRSGSQMKLDANVGKETKNDVEMFLLRVDIHLTG